MFKQAATYSNHTDNEELTDCFLLQPQMHR